MNTPEIENDETVRCEALTRKLISSAKGKSVNTRRGIVAAACRTEASVLPGKVPVRRKLCHQPSFSKSCSEISCFPLFDILTGSPGLSL